MEYNKIIIAQLMFPFLVVTYAFSCNKMAVVRGTACLHSRHAYQVSAVPPSIAGTSPKRTVSNILPKKQYPIIAGRPESLPSSWQ